MNIFIDIGDTEWKIEKKPLGVERQRQLEKKAKKKYKPKGKKRKKKSKH